eukprot:3829785-Rhodomonas_salina.2
MAASLQLSRSILGWPGAWGSAQFEQIRPSPLGERVNDVLFQHGATDSGGEDGGAEGSAAQASPKSCLRNRPSAQQRGAGTMRSEQ